MDRYKRLVSNTLILALGQFGSKFLSTIMMRFYTEQLGRDGYGAVSNIRNASTLVMAIVTISIGESIIRFGLDKNYDKSQIFSIGLITTLIGALGFAAFAPALNLVEFLSAYVWLIFLYVFTGSVKSSCALFVRSAGYVRLFALDGVFTTVVNIIFNLIFMLGFNMGVTGYVLSVVLSDLASVIFLFFMADLKQYFHFAGLDKRVRAEMYRFCLPMMPTTVIWWITNVSDGFFITRIVGVGSNGLYSAAYTLPNVIAIISGIFSQAWNMSAITEKNSRTIARFYSNVFNIFQSVIYIIAAGAMLIVKPFLGIMASSEFNDAYKYAPVLIMAVIFTCFSTFMGSVYVASKKSVRSMLTALGGAIANLILNALFIPVWGIQGASVATLISYMIIFISRAVDSRKIVLMDMNLPKMATNLLLLAGMGFAVVFAENMTFFYATLVPAFVLAVIINFRSGLAAIDLIRKKR